MKSFSVRPSQRSRQVMYESASCLALPSLGISRTETWKPISVASPPLANTNFSPAPNFSPSLGMSQSGMKHRLQLNLLKYPSCSFDQQPPSEAITLAIPNDWRRITSGAPSTRYTLPDWRAAFMAISMPKMDVLFRYIRLSRPLRYLTAACGLILLAVKVCTLPYLSRCGIIKRPR